MSVSVGIDLGTTFSLVAYVNPQTKLPEVIPNAEGNKLTPSVIQFYKGSPIFGSEAEEAFNAGEDNCAATFKREMGEEGAYCVFDGKSYSSEDLSSLLLAHLKQDAEAVLGDKIQDAVITVPAYFYDKQREATLRAAERAGLKVKKLIDEPNAAAMAYGLNHWRENANILVYDLGGGTFDVTLVHMKRGGLLETVATDGSHKLGGRDWDSRLEDILISKFEDETELDIRGDLGLQAIVGGLSERVKKQLSAPNMQKVKVAASFPGFGKAIVSVDRDEFEAQTADLLETTGTFIRKVLEEAGVSLREITDVLLVGGSTRMPQVSSYLQKLFHKKPLSHVHPDEAVALGAAIQSTKKVENYSLAAIQVVDGKKKTDRSRTGLGQHLAVKPEKKLNDVSSLGVIETTRHAMGVVAISDEGNRYYNEIIIPANHPRPVRLAKRFRFLTSPNLPNELAIYVLQGDSPNPIECQIPYKYIVSGIKHVKRGERLGTVIRIQYSYDANGVIHIQARQEDATVDLPIRRENVSTDISRFGRPVVSAAKKDQGFNVGLQLGTRSTQGLVHKYKAVTFSNVEWKKYDNVITHTFYPEYSEPERHVIASEKRIEFHGYHVSNMNEGVKYSIDPMENFEIECDIDTSSISPHPGGFLEITLGIISAHLTENGGDIILQDETVTHVGPRFHLQMSFTDGGQYEISINGKLAGSKYQEADSEVTVKFGFVHDSHCCELLSHAYVSDISMTQGSSNSDDDNPDTDVWET